MKVAPSGQFVVAAIGTAGVLVFPFNTTNGSISTAYVTIPTGSATVGSYSATLDKNNILYVGADNGFGGVFADDGGGGDAIDGVSVCDGKWAAVADADHDECISVCGEPGERNDFGICDDGYWFLVDANCGFAIWKRDDA